MLLAAMPPFVSLGTESVMGIAQGAERGIPMVVAVIPILGDDGMILTVMTPTGYDTGAVLP